jgi:putative ABC transport system permease protein
MSDLKFAFRQLLKNPGFTAVAVVTLALGIGANTAIFSLINSVLLKPVMSRDPHQLVGLYQQERENSQSYQLFSYPDFKDLQKGKEVFSDLVAMGLTTVGLRQGDLTLEVHASLVSANYVAMLGVVPAMGRGFLPEEEISAAPVVVLSHAFWQRLGGDPNIVGRVLKLSDGEMTVVGVMPKGFTGVQLMAPSMFLPLGLAERLHSHAGQSNEHILTDRGQRRFMLFGRLKPGLDLANVGGSLAVLNARFPLADPSEPKGRTLLCTSPARFDFSNVPSRFNQMVAPVAAMALGLSALVLVIASLNLASMMLVRGMARRREMAVRLALGAARGRILRQMLTEGLLLALIGGGAGLLLSTWAANLLRSFMAAGIPDGFPEFDFAPDWRMLAALLVFSSLATLVFALGPAWKLARLDINTDLKQQTAEEIRGPRATRLGFQNTLAIGQMALSLALLVAAALFTRSAFKAMDATPGFEFGSNFYVRLKTSLTGATEPQARELVRATMERLRSLPGVESVSPAMNVPLGEDRWVRGVQLGGAPPASRDAGTLKEGKQVVVTYNVVGLDYFRTLGVGLLEGREFERLEVESTNAPPVAIVTRNLAAELWPGQDPLGRSLQFGDPGESKSAPQVMTVVGVVPAVDWDIFERKRPAGIYVPLGQQFLADPRLHVRLAPGVDPTPVMLAARKELYRMDARVPLVEVKTLRALHRDGMSVRIVRLGAILFGAFGIVATLLCCVGVYGLKAYAVAHRTREIGIRIAIGATPNGVLGMILAQSAWLSALGLSLGFLLAVGIGRVASQFLYQVPGFDPLTFALAPLLMLAMVLLACWIPARRATKIDLMKALRYE